ncbi:hypothetical protein DFH09DRAFT_1355836 [Mycena vulgaris]|nr:hypothetical protein DFH09DRAFT_1355836 [Mycena vulgaris]
MATLHYPAASVDGQMDNYPLTPVRYTPSASSASNLTVPFLDSGRKKSGIDIWVPLAVIGGTLVAAAFAIGHHALNAHLDAHPVSGFWTQTKSSRVEIFLASAVKVLFCFSAGVSLCQLSWYSLRRQPVTLADIDALVGEPSLMILPRLNLIIQTPLIIAMTMAILASPLITILAPSLNTHEASAITRTLTVPTLNTTTDGMLNDVYLSTTYYGSITEAWDKAALVALLSANPVGWPMPEGCSPECEYNITYSAPAIRCSDLLPDQIDDGVLPMYRYVQRVFQDPPAAYLKGYDAESIGSGYNTSPLNFTVQNVASNVTEQYSWTLAYVPYLASNGDVGALINAAGSVCTFYNATHVASTHYFNGTQESRVSVVEFHDPLNTTYRMNSFTMDLTSGTAGVFAPGIGSHIHLLAMADAVSKHLEGSLVFGHYSTLTTTTLLTETNIFKPFDVDGSGQVQSQIYGLNTTASVTNVSQALQDLVANATLGFIHLNTATTTVDATVSSNAIIYIYDRTSLVATYSVAMFLLVLMSAVGMFCLLQNGEPSSNKFSRLLVAMRNPDLDVVADAVNGHAMDMDPARVRLTFGEAALPGRGENLVFGLARKRSVYEEKVDA